jgi:hypothetical protein
MNKITFLLLGLVVFLFGVFLTLFVRIPKQRPREITVKVTNIDETIIMEKTIIGSVNVWRGKTTNHVYLYEKGQRHQYIFPVEYFIYINSLTISTE